MTASWVVEEFGGVDLGDERRKERLIEIVTAFAQTPGGALSRACPDEAAMRATTRFLDNDNFEDADLLQGHLQQTIARIQDQALVYCPQDTTTINYEGLKATKGLGPISQSARTRGLLLHSSLAVSPERVCLGVLHQNLWTRQPGKRVAQERKHLPIDQKESFKWLGHLRVVNELAANCPDTTLVSITDREGDIYNMLVEPRQPNVELLIRAAHNRVTMEDGERSRLWEELRRAPVKTQISVNVPKQRNRPARRALLDVSFKRVTVAESKWMRENKAFSTGIHEVDVWAVIAEEKHPPESVKSPICWMLYSSRAIENADQAVAAVDAYSIRWVIEVWHKALKSGLKIEEKQAKDSRRLMRSLTILSVIGWRIMYIMTLSRISPDEPCTICFEDDEWKAAWCRHHRTPYPPASPPPLREFVRMLCKISGFMGRKNEGEPGVKRLTMALDYLAPMTDTYRALTQHS